ncbi:MAG: glycosyltransferase [Methylobacter sp.]
MSLIKSANSCYQLGDFAKAVLLYEQAIEEQPQLAALYQFSLERARRRLQEQCPQHTRDSSCKYLIDLYREVTKALNEGLITMMTRSLPRVNVIMTTHNDAPYIEEAVTSILRQSYPNLDVLVIDNASTDATWAILQRLEKSSPRIRSKRLNSSLDISFVKNHGLALAEGEYIFFQDGSDLSHPERIRLSMNELMRDGVVGVRCSYSRVIFPEGRVIPGNNGVNKPDLMTLGVRKTVFDEINSISAAESVSDDEIFGKLIAFADRSGGVFKNIELSLYFSTIRECVPRSEVEGNFPLNEDATIKKVDIILYENPAVPVVVSLCSIPERAELLKRTLASLAPQVDRLNVYLDRYESEPEFVRTCHPQVRVILSGEHPGLRDGGKFLPFSQIDKECYYFTADDDILYPSEYVRAMIRKIEYYDRRAVVGVHGVLLPDYPQGYFSGFRQVFLFKQALERDHLVSNLGTGTVAFHSSCLRGLDYRSFTYPGMADIYFSVFCKRNNIPMVAVARPENWLQEMASSSPTLYEEYRSADKHQASLVQTNSPWGYTAIQQAVDSVRRHKNGCEAGKHLGALIPDLTACLW